MSDQKVITIPAAEWEEFQKNQQEMAKKIAGLESGDKPKIMKSPKEHLITVSFVNGKPVVGYVNRGTPDKPVYIYEAVNPKKPSEYLLYVDVILKGDEQNPVRLVYLEFMEQAERHECLVTKTRDEPWETFSGTVNRKTVPEGEYYTDELGIVVPLEVKGVIKFYTVRLPDGKEIELHERFCNINK